MDGSVIRHWSPTGEPLELLEWAEMFERRHHDPDQSWWRVGRDTVGDVEISTAWVGIDLQPLIFESLVMGGALNDETRRYATWSAAQAGHAQLVELVRLDQASQTQSNSDQWA